MSRISNNFTPPIAGLPSVARGELDGQINGGRTSSYAPAPQAQRDMSSAQYSNSVFTRREDTVRHNLAPERQSDRDQLNQNPYHDQWAYELKEEEFSTITDDRIREFLKEERPDLQRALLRRSDGYNLMRQYLELVRDYDVAREYIHCYAGNPRVFKRSLTYHVDLLTQARENAEWGEYDLDIYFKKPELKTMDDQWRQQKERGWRAEFRYAPQIIGGVVSYGYADRSSKIVRFSLIPGFERPISLGVAEEVIHTHQADLNDLNQHYFVKYVGNIFGDIYGQTLPAPASKVYELVANFHMLLHEYDARLQLMQHYRALVGRHPELRTMLWDGLTGGVRLFSRGVLLDYLRESSYADGLPEQIFDLIRSRSCDDIYLLIHGIRAKDLSRMGKTLAHNQTISEDEVDEFVRNTPAVIRELGADKVAGKSVMGGASMSESDVADILVFLRNPALAEKTNVLWDTLNSDENDLLNDRVRQCFALLYEYDREHGTTHVRDEGIRLIGVSRPPATCVHSDILFAAAYEIVNDTDHAGVGRLLSVLADSPLRSMLYKLNEEGDGKTFINLIRAAMNAAPDERPRAAVLVELAEEYFDRIAQLERMHFRELDHEVQNRSFETAKGYAAEIPKTYEGARDVAHALKEYFSAVRDSKNAQIFGNHYGVFDTKANWSFREVVRRYDAQAKSTKKHKRKGRRSKGRRKKKSRK